MHFADASFTVRLLASDPGDQEDVDRALNIFVRNTSPLLRTKTNQIRAKIASPVTPEGHFYFVALYRSGTVIGFAMFGYYPRARLVAIDHMVIDRDQRGDAAFYVFAQLLHDVIQRLGVEVDFTAVEIESGTDFGGEGSGGHEMVRLLGQVAFGQVHTNYVLANMEPRNFEARYDGILMLRGSQKLFRIRREELLEIVHCILFDHYLPWYRDFFGTQIETYRGYLEELYRSFEKSLDDKAVIKINGPEADALISHPAPVVKRTPEVLATWYIALFGATAAVVTIVLYVLHLPPYLTVPFLLTLLAVFVGVAAASRGRALEVFERVLTKLSVGRQKSRCQDSDENSQGVELDQPTPKMRTGSAGQSGDK